MAGEACVMSCYKFKSPMVSRACVITLSRSQAATGRDLCRVSRARSVRRVGDRPRIRMSEALLEAVRGLRVADSDLGFKPLLAKLRAQQPELGAATKEVREAVNALKAESEAKAAAAASPDKASALSHAALRAKSSQSAPWIQPGLKPLPPTALHQWVHEHDEEASVSEVPPSDTSVWAQFPESSSSPAEDGDWLNWPEQLLLRGTEAVGPPSPLCISRE